MPSDFYCDEVLSGKTAVEKVLETNDVLAFHHTRPFWETHIVVIPKNHVDSLLTIANERLLLEILEVVRRVAYDVVAKTGAARVLTNLGDYQDSKHLHFHVNSGKQIRSDGG
jgi:histidine triad (HIT) family protein